MQAALPSLVVPYKTSIYLGIIRKIKESIKTMIFLFHDMHYFSINQIIMFPFIGIQILKFVSNYDIPITLWRKSSRDKRNTVSTKILCLETYVSRILLACFLFKLPVAISLYVFAQKLRCIPSIFKILQMIRIPKLRFGHFVH